MRLRSWFSGVAAAAIGAGLLAAVAPSAQAAAVPTTGAVFNNPVGTDAEKRAIQNKIVELVDGAPAGSRIRMSWFYADDPTVPNALIAAKNRGVNVQVIFSTTDNTAPYAGLVSALGTSTSAASFITFCGANRGCVGNRPLNGVNSINHNKFIIFSASDGAANVVVQTTANLHDGRDGLRGWNAAMVLVGNAAIYNAYSGYFDDLRGKVVNNNIYDTRVPVTAGTAKIHFFPRQEGNGNPYGDPAEDTVMTVLNGVECFGNSSVGTQDGTFRTVIRVNVFSLSRTYLAQKLVDLDAAGCYVEVVTVVDPTNASLVTSVNTLLKKTGSAYGGVAVKYYCTSDSTWTHAKYFQVEGKYFGGADRRVTWVGSHNWSYNSLRQSDETLLQSEDAAMFEAFRANFRANRDTPNIRSVANGGATACPAAAGSTDLRALVGA